MPVCTNSRCKLAGINQPASAFERDTRVKDRLVKRCRDCRKRHGRGAWREGPLSLPAAPFTAWMRETFATRHDAAVALEIDSTTTGHIMAGEASTVLLGTVDRACLAWGISIDSLYPLGAASLPGTETVPPR